MNWKAAPLKHRDEDRIALYFEKNQELIQQVKQIRGARWSQQKKLWHIPDTIENRIQFELQPQHVQQLSLNAIHYLEKFKQWLQSKRYSPNTITTYAEALKTFLLFFPEKNIPEIDNNDVILFNNNYILDKKLSESYQK